MSHFIVLVTGPDHVAALRPFHEFESTGRDDEFVQDIDQTAEVRAAFEAATTTRWQAPDGTLHDPYEDRFYREFTPEEIEKYGPLRMMGTGGGGGLTWTSQDWNDGKGYRVKAHMTAEEAGMIERKLKRSEAESFREYVEEYEGRSIVPFGEAPDLADEHKYGYALVDDKGEITKVVRRTNPNDRWDWYEVGGRWEGYIRTKDGRDVNQARIGDIDWEYRRQKAAAEAADRWDRFHTLTGGKTWTAWKTFAERAEAEEITWDEAREQYGNQCVVKLARGHDDFSWDTDQFLVSRQAYIQEAGDSAGIPGRFLVNGEWHERGKMLMFGVSDDTMTNADWRAKFWSIFSLLPQDTIVTAVDCHI